MPKITIIIPVYQVEQYLGRCIHSVIRQTYQDFECILVDDGSTDRSGSICDWYAQNYSQFRVVHKLNGGLSSARNTALNIAKGEYICFLDSDDMLHPQALECMLKAIEEADADMVTTGLFEFYEDDVLFDKPENGKIEVMGQDTFINHLFPTNFGKISVTACGKLYHRIIFESLRFPEGKIYEDLCVFMDVLLSCKKIAVLQSSLYYYYRNPASITRSSYLAHNRFGEFEVRETYISFFEKRGLTQQVQYAENDYLTFFMRNFLAVMLRYPQRKVDLTPHILTFRKHLPHLLVNSRICRMRKICAVLMLIFPCAAYQIAKRTIPDCLIEEMRV